MLSVPAVAVDTKSVRGFLKASGSGATAGGLGACKMISAQEDPGAYQPIQAVAVLLIERWAIRESFTGA